MPISRLLPASFEQPNPTNLVINGNMAVSQRGTSSTGITASGYRSAPDRFRPSIGTAGTWTISQSTDVPTGYGFTNSYKFDCTTADASLAVGDDMALQYRFEGQDVQILKKGTSNAVPVTVSFWVKSTKTGTFILELMDNDNAREISKSYTVSSSNTWEYKTVTFEGDTTGALDNDTARSLTLQWWLAAGTNWTSGTLNTSWADPATANRVVGQVNIADSTSNDWLLTGVCLNVGSKSISGNDGKSFPHESYTENLQKCLRYYEISAQSYGLHYSTSNSIMPVPYKVHKRVTPSSSLRNDSGGGDHGTSNNAGNYAYWTNQGANTAELIADAEL